MARVTVEDCLQNVDSRFTLVHLAVRRVLQLRHGAPAAMENVKGNKEVVLALREIAAERITVENIRQIEETRPIPTEPTPAEREIARVDLREILEEATSFNPSVEYEGPDQFLEGELDPEQNQQESEEE